MEKPRVLVLGGCGFVGRNFVSFLVSHELVSFVRVVDKVPPQVAWLNETCQEYFRSPIVEFKSANLINSESCKNAFAPVDSHCWDYVVNCAGETKLGQTDPVYEEGVLRLSLNCAQETAKQNATLYVELSSGNMFSSDKLAHKEDGPIEPWGFVAKWKRQVEKQLSEIPNLRYSILRPASIYGPGDRIGLTPRILVAAIYRKLNEPMKLLWNADLKVNTVHVQDVCRAIWFICIHNSDTVNQTFNVVDDADSSQGSIGVFLADLFSIQVEYYGTLVSAVVDLAAAADDANDKHLGPWAEACREDGVQNTPLTPHMDPELLLHKHLHLDGSKLRKLGFEYDVPKPTSEAIKAVIEDFVRMKVFPHSLAI